MTTRTREARAETHERRRKARGTVLGKRLGVSEDQLDFNGFKYRWINDDPARIYEKTKNDDWDICTQDGGTVKGEALDGAVFHVVGANPDGSARRAYLCRKPKKFWEEDQAAKMADLDEQLAQLRRGKTRSGADQADYVPDSGISIR